jgi:COP9 signalosome complex subunit 5
MGLLQGKVQNDTFVVIDSFALPVEGTETRVNAQAEAYEYMVDFQGTSKVCCDELCAVLRRAMLCE